MLLLGSRSYLPIDYYLECCVMAIYLDYFSVPFAGGVPYLLPITVKRKGEDKALFSHSQTSVNSRHFKPKGKKKRWSVTL